MKKKLYKCTPSATVVLLTLLATAVVVAVSITAFTIVPEDDNVLLSVASCVVGIIWVYYLSMLVACPRYLKMEDKKLVLISVLRRKTFYYDDINQIKRISRLHRGKRTGSRGIFGYIGKIINPNKRPYIMLFNNKKTMMEVLYGDEIFIISCSQPDEFIQELKTRTPH